MKLFTWVLWVFFWLLGCDSPWRWERTPAGYLAAWKHEYAPAGALVALDAAIDRAAISVATEDMLPVALVYQLMETSLYYLFPGPFETDDSETGWASGQAPPGAFILARRVPGSNLEYPALEHEIRHRWYFTDWSVGH
jgi:hypothetical protein